MKSTLASVLAVFALTPIVALADPTDLEVNVFCPYTSGAGNVLANHGDYIAGNGEEIVNGMGRKTIYFKSTDSLPQNIPAKLNNYRHEKAEYDSTTARVSCVYTSFMEGEPSFNVSYTLTNGRGGMIIAQTPDHVTFRLPVGFKA